MISVADANRYFKLDSTNNNKHALEMEWNVLMFHQRSKILVCSQQRGIVCVWKSEENKAWLISMKIDNTQLVQLKSLKQFQQFSLIIVWSIV